VMLRARWVTLRARWVMLRACWVTLQVRMWLRSVPRDEDGGFTPRGDRVVESVESVEESVEPAAESAEQTATDTGLREEPEAQKGTSC
jgi:hypothetical protein